MSSDTTTTTGADISTDEMFETLTGFDEQAIVQHFGKDITMLAQDAPTMFTRALVFVHLTRVRPGDKHKDCKQAAMEMTLGGVQAYFPDAEPEVDPEDPVTESGKDDEQPS